MRHLDTICIAGLEVDCVVGVHRHERDAPQLLRVDVSLRLDTDAAGESQRISRTVDYQQVAAQIVFILQSGRFRLVETAARALARHLLAPPLPDESRPRVASVELCLAKPSALDGRAVPSLRISREADWARLPREARPFGSLDAVHESPEVGIYRLSVLPGAAASLSACPRMGEAVMSLGDGLLCGGLPFSLGSIHRWSPGEAHEYQNPTRTSESILIVREGDPSMREQRHLPLPVGTEGV